MLEEVKTPYHLLWFLNGLRFWRRNGLWLRLGLWLRDGISGIGTLWAIELKSDQPVGTWIRDWCWENGMILRNNGNMLVIAPALVMSFEEFDLVMDFLHKGIQAAMKHFKIK